MVRTSTALVVSIFALVAGPALAQLPTHAQQQALKANCVADFRTYCSGVPTHSMEALVCIEQNVDSLSPGCKAAVEALDGESQSTSSN